MGGGLSDPSPPHPGRGKLLSATTLNILTRGQKQFPKLNPPPGIEVTQGPSFNPPSRD